MNIFVLHEVPEIAAMMLCDQHIGNQHIGNQQKESIQILSTTAHIYGLAAPYKPTHINHPATKWVRSSLQAYDWLFRHVLGMREEYVRRYGKPHKSGLLLESCPTSATMCRYISYCNGGVLRFTRCMPESYKRNDPVESYRLFYKGEKAKFATWRHSRMPNWYSQN